MIGLFVVGDIVYEVGNRNSAVEVIGNVLMWAAIILAIAWPLMAWRRKSTRKRQARREHAREYARFQADWQAWKQAMDSWDAGERARIDQARLWFPVVSEPSVSRIDVFGGTSDGWASLITTLGASLLAARRSMVVLDLTERDVSTDLSAMAQVQGIPVNVVDLPSGEGHARVLAGFSSDDLAEIISGAIETSRESGSVELRATDARLIRCVTDRLDGNRTLHRIRAGLQVLRRAYDEGDRGDPPLSDAEFLRLSDYIDLMGQDDQTQRELQFLIDCLDLLAVDETTAQAKEEDDGFWQQGALVIRTADRSSRRKDMTDRVLVQALISRLRQAEARMPAGGTVVIVGCDHIGLKPLEDVTELARRAGLKTVLVLEHLRGDLTQLLGGSDSASVIMRLGNAQEAAAAAEYIGRGYKFVMSQVSRQLSQGFADGESDQRGGSDSVSNSYGRGGGFSSSFGSGGGGSSHSNWNKSRSFTRSDTWSRTVNWSTTRTSTEGNTSSRVYEFTVEPTQIQAMPTTAFILVGASGGERRIVAGDCNPGISLLDRVAVEASGSSVTELGEARA